MTTAFVALTLTIAADTRLVTGFNQTGASSTAATQSYFVDFFTTRPLGSGENAYDNPVNLWGNLRIASAPQQIDVPVPKFVLTFDKRLAGLSVNRMAQSGEFTTGIEVRARRFRADHSVRTLGIVAFFGATGSFTDPGISNRIFLDARTADYYAITAPDRERFYRQYGAGIRYSSYSLDDRTAPASMFTLTAGQDQHITGGRYHGVTLKLDTFYPVAIRSGVFFYVFGTANLAVSRPRVDNRAPPQLAEVTTPLPASAKVTTLTISSSRDTYRLGVGLDLLSLLRRRGSSTGQP